MDEELIDDYDDEYFDDIADDMLTSQRDDNVSVGSGDDVNSDVMSSDVTSMNDEEEYERKQSVVDQMREDFEKFRKMHNDKEKMKVRKLH